MQIHIIAIGECMLVWFEEGFAEYAKRLPREYCLELHEIPTGQRTMGAVLQTLIEQEDAPAGRDSFGYSCYCARPRGQKVGY